jgi:hypothetical protein
MTAQEFVTWLKGFVAGSNNYNLTPKGWEEVREKLSSVNKSTRVSFGTTSNSTATTLPSEASVNYTTSNKNLLHD